MMLLNRTRVIPVAVVLLLAVTLSPRTEGAGPESDPLVWETTLPGDGDAALRWPVGIASAAVGEIAVADASGSRLVVFREGEKGWLVERTISLPGTPYGVAGSGDLYLLSIRGPASLVTVNRKTWQQRPLPLPRGAAPAAVAPQSGGGFLVQDAAGGEILSVSPVGSVTRHIPAPRRFRAIAAAPPDGYFAADAPAGSVARYDGEGEIRDLWELVPDGPIPPWPVALAVEGRGRLLVLDRHAARLLVLEPGGVVRSSYARHGRGEGRFAFPSAITVIPDGRLAIADLGNARVQIFSFAKTDRGAATSSTTGDSP